MKKSPLAQVKEQFGSKEKLVDALIGLPASVIERPADEAEDKDAFRHRLLVASNTKLLRLHRVGKSVSDRWGSKEKPRRCDPRSASPQQGQGLPQQAGHAALGKLFDQVSSLENAAKRVAGHAQAQKARKAAKKSA